MKRYRKGLVVGKFSPMHIGHEALIEYATAFCDQVLILSYSNPTFPKCDDATRERWLKSRFPQAQVVVVGPEIMLEGLPLPFNDESDLFHRQFCARVLVDVIGTTVDAVFSSETYGQGFAEFLTRHFQTELHTTFTVEHNLYDLDRTKIPISGTAVRQDPMSMRPFLSSNVFASLIPKVVMLGGESSGKTTLCKALAAELDTAWVSEYGRDLWEQRGGELRYEDMLHIAKTQVKSEMVLARRFGNKLLVCDTSPLTTLWYSYRMFNGHAHAELEVLANREYDYTVLCAPTIPFDQDGTRRDDAFRQAGHAWYIEQLDMRGVKYIVVDGTVEERVAQVRKYVGM